MEHIECIVIGAGVVGLATARALTLKGLDVLVLESENAVGTIISARNSGVIHAGLYYAPGSLKAKACITGREKLYSYCAERGIPHERCGKLVVATTEEQILKLHELKANAETSGVESLRVISGEDAQILEPELRCLYALDVPVTGILDTPAYIQSLLGDVETHGGSLALNAPVVGGDVTKEDLIVLNVGGAAPMDISCRTLVNAAGLGAQSVARNLRGLDPASVPPQVLAKGSYFVLSGPLPFKRLIYPLPVPGSLGLHYSYDMGHQTRFGPDIEWVDEIDYRVDSSRAAQFEEAIQAYWPRMPRGAFQAAYAGVRPKISRSSPHNSDFVIQTSKDHGIQGLINLYGIESPGLTSSLALGDMVLERLMA